MIPLEGEPSPFQGGEEVRFTAYYEGILGFDDYYSTSFLSA
ncbi:hypothetical protein [Saccharolobus islandicus]